MEAVVALAVLVALLAGLAGVWTMAMTETVAARERTLAAQLARDKLEQLASLTWTVRSVDGSDLLVSDVTTDVSRRPATTTGFGTASSPDDSLRVSRATYADYLDERGEWVGAGPSPPPPARYVRRWWIGRTGTGASELLLYQVMVTTLKRAAAVTESAGDGPEGAWWQAHPDAAWLCGAKLRRSV